MSLKRNTDDSSSKGNFEGNLSPNDKRRRSYPSFRSVVLEVMRQRSIQHVLEPMLRKIVKEEVESAVRKHVISFKRKCEEDVPSSEPRSLQLKFMNKLSLPVFTGTRIEGEDGCPIKVVLIDSCTDEVVQFTPESSARVEIVVLEGDFDAVEGDNWTPEEFKNYIVRERSGKKPLLAGDVYLCLKEGIGCVGEISFTDNSSWTRSRRFRLGARVVGNSDKAQIRETKTESFVVRDHRGELYKKHHPPSLFDEVWRLEKIGKDGAFHKRLCSEGLNTVKEFLTLLHLDPTRLRNIMGSGMSTKMWEVTTEHARTCVLDNKVYLYNSTNFGHSKGLVFNVVGQVMGLYSESQYVPIDKLSETEKLDVQSILIEAFQHWDGVTSFEDINSLTGVSLCTETPNASNLLTSQEINRLDYPQPTISSPDIFSSFDDFPLHGVDSLDMRYEQPPIIPSQITNSLLCGTDSLAQAFTDEHLGFLDLDYSIHSTNPSFESQVQSRSSAHRRWRVLSSVLRWFSIRRAVMRRADGQKIQRL